MRRLLSSGLIVLAGAVNPVSMSPHQVHGTVLVTRPGDYRLESLRRFFQRFDCPAEQYSSQFLEAADNYGLDWRLLPSISFVESTGGKNYARNNMFGWNNGRTQFPSASAGIYQVGYQLAYSDVYRDKDLDTVLKIYNPVGPYAQKVKAVMEQIAPAQ